MSFRRAKSKEGPKAKKQRSINENAKMIFSETMNFGKLSRHNEQAKLAAQYRFQWLAVASNSTEAAVKAALYGTKYVPNTRQCAFIHN